MKKLIQLFIIVLFTSCVHRSGLKQESGVIVDKQFSPEFNARGDGIGFSTGGDIVFTSNDYHKAEEFLLVIKCQHNTVFTVNKKELYAVLEKGDSVYIQYKEILTDNNNSLVGFDFINASKK